MIDVVALPPTDLAQPKPIAQSQTIQSERVTQQTTSSPTASIAPPESSRSPAASVALANQPSSQQAAAANPVQVAAALSLVVEAISEPVNAPPVKPAASLRRVSPQPVAVFEPAAVKLASPVRRLATSNAMALEPSASSVVQTLPNEKGCRDVVFDASGRTCLDQVETANAERRKILDQRLTEIVRQRQSTSTKTTGQQRDRTVQPVPVYESPEPTELPGYNAKVTALRRAIVGQESSGNFKAVNRHSGALGYAQIMPNNLPSWSRDAVGRLVTKQEFLSNPRLQIQIIEHRLAKYWQRALVASGGNERLAVRQVASLWYSGRLNLYNSTKPQFYKGNRYPSIANYTLSVLKRYLSEVRNPQLASTDG